MANEFSIEEKFSELFGHQINWNNIPPETVKEYWQRLVYLSSLAKIKPRSVKNRRHSMNYV